MPKVSEMIVSKFLRKEDFDEDQICTIKGVSQENVGRDDSDEMRWALWFKERPKAMILNVTSIRVLETAYGPDTDMWVGNKVMVYVDPNVSFGGKVVGGLRLRTPKKQAVKAPIAPIDTDFDQDIESDGIPF
jgi:hypothetical protein